MIIAGIAIAAIGALLLLSQQVPWLRLGRLPGDIHIQRDGVSIYIPIVTMLLVSAILTAIFLLIGWLRR